MKVLVMTVGAGNSANLEGTLFEPALLSLGGFDRAILLPSSDTLIHAKEIAERARKIGVVIGNADLKPLAPFQEDNADKCFRHFYDVLAALRAEPGMADDDIHVDFTRGTKGMSAALVLAAAMHGLTHHRYLGGERDPVTNLVKAGKTVVIEFEAQEAQTARILESARSFMKAGRYASVDALLKPLTWYKDFGQTAKGQEAAWVRSNAEFFAAWDRFDYAKAASLPLGAPPSGWEVFAPGQALQAWLGALATKPGDHDRQGMAAYYRKLACDLTGSARRRLAHGEYEDSLLRCYRILELVGQKRLLVLGYDPSDIPLRDERARAFNDAIFGGRLDRNALSVKRRHFEAARMSGAHFLEYLGDEFGPILAGFDEGLDLPVARRNQSVLAHGNQGSLDPVALTRLVDKVEDLLVQEDPHHARERLELLTPDWARI